MYSLHFFPQLVFVIAKCFKPVPISIYLSIYDVVTASATVTIIVTVVISYIHTEKDSGRAAQRDSILVLVAID
jgi:hypothetical protein